MKHAFQGRVARAPTSKQNVVRILSTLRVFLSSGVLEKTLKTLGSFQMLYSFYEFWFQDLIDKLGFAQPKS